MSPAIDVELGITLERVGVPAHSNLDAEGRQLFVALGLEYERNAKRDETDWFWRYSQDAREGFECCSRYWLGAHYLSAMRMYGMEDFHHQQCEGAGQVPS